MISMNSYKYEFESHNAGSQTTGKEGLSGSPDMKTKDDGEYVATIPLGEGYYFVPPITNKKISEIGQQYFD